MTQCIVQAIVQAILDALNIQDDGFNRFYTKSYRGQINYVCVPEGFLEASAETIKQLTVKNIVQINALNTSAIKQSVKKELVKLAIQAGANQAKLDFKSKIVPAVESLLGKHTKSLIER